MFGHHEKIASLHMSGLDVKIGRYTHGSGQAVTFKTPEMSETLHISIAEAQLLIAALTAACAVEEG